MILYWNGSSTSGGMATVPVPDEGKGISLANWDESIRDQWREELASNTPAAHMAKLINADKTYIKCVNGNSWAYLQSQSLLWATHARLAYPKEEILMVLTVNSPHMGNYIPIGNQCYIRWLYELPWFNDLTSFSGEPWNFLEVFTYDNDLITSHLAEEMITREQKNQLRQDYKETFDYIEKNMAKMYRDGYASAKQCWIPQVKALVAYFKSLNIKCFINLDWFDEVYPYPKGVDIPELYDDIDMVKFFNREMEVDSGTHPSSEQNRVWAEHLLSVMRERGILP